MGRGTRRVVEDIGLTVEVQANTDSIAAKNHMSTRRRQNIRGVMYTVDLLHETCPSSSWKEEIKSPTC
jgi:hypothetical protein